MSSEQLTGPALDAEVGRAVFEYRVINPELVGVAAQDVRSAWRLESLPYPPGGIRYERVPAYSTDIGTAWSVVEQMMALGWHARLTTPFERGERWFCGFTPLGMTGWNGRPDHQAGAESMPLAICRAALKALVSNGVPTTKWGD